MVIQNCYFVATNQSVNHETQINNFSSIVIHKYSEHYKGCAASSMFLQSHQLCGSNLLLIEMTGHHENFLPFFVRFLSCTAIVITDILRQQNFYDIVQSFQFVEKVSQLAASSYTTSIPDVHKASTKRGHPGNNGCHMEFDGIC